MVTNTFIALSSLLWGIQNNGDSQRISIDHFTSGYVLGVKGEDIHPASPISGDGKITVAVLDTGIDSTHPDLKDKIAPNGYNFVNNNDNTSDQHGHGTHISGIIANQTTQHALILPIKVVQTGPNAPIRPQETTPGAGTALTENVAKGIVYAIQKGARVINLSLAWPSSIRSKAVDDAMKLAAEKEVLVIASAANDSTSANIYPCIYSNVICVGAHGPDGSFTYFSNHGSMVDVLAPGIAILSTWPMNKAPVTFAGQIGYEFRNGTSMAAPYVSGAAAELLFRGYSARETMNRILLGSRPTRREALFHSNIVGDFSTDHKKESKFARFGNLDIAGSIRVEPQPMVIPEMKSRIELNWNGRDPWITAKIQWVNRWKKAISTQISFDSKIFYFDQIDENEVLTTPITLPISSKTESTLTLTATVKTVGMDGKSFLHQFPISLQINRTIAPASFPENASFLPIKGLNPQKISTIRSIITSDVNDEPGFYSIFDDELTLIEKDKVSSSKQIDGIGQETILNLYRIQKDRYGIVSLKKTPGKRDAFIIRILDSSLSPLKLEVLDTDVTLLNENLVWKSINGMPTPLWIAAGTVPSLDLPPDDPWSPIFENSKIPRIYFILNGNLRTLLLDDHELPIKILPDHRVLIAKGSSYFAEYYLLDLDLDLPNKIHSRSKLSLNSYRMLIGLDSSVQKYSLKDGKISGTVFSGISTPGNLRLTTLSESSMSSDDVILNRENSLDSLVKISGFFQGTEEQYSFVQSRFDLKFFRTSSHQSSSISLNRFSYIPSMIFNRAFFPLIIENHEKNRLPGLYIPASVANDEVSEIIVGDPSTGEISKPALLRFKAVEGCRPVGNLVPATSTEPSKLAFFCLDQLVLIPIQF